MTPQNIVCGKTDSLSLLLLPIFEGSKTPGRLFAKEKATKQIHRSVQKANEGSK
jgi:hypothetical protein